MYFFVDVFVSMSAVTIENNLHLVVCCSFPVLTLFVLMLVSVVLSCMQWPTVKLKNLLLTGSYRVNYVSSL